MDRVSIERMCAGREFQVEGTNTETQKKPAKKSKVASNMEWSGKICIGRTQGSGRKIVRNESREDYRCTIDHKLSI